MLRGALPLLLLALLLTPVQADDAEVVLSRPLVSSQVFPWPIRGDVGKCFVDEQGRVWMPTSLGEVARLDWRKAKADPEDPEAWTVFDLGEDLWLTSVHGLDGKVWVVGRTDGWRGVVFEWDGEAWRGVYLGDRLRCSQLHDVIALSPEAIHACGHGDSGVHLRFDGTSWREHDTGDAYGLYRFYDLPGKGLFATGSLGRIFVWSERRWRLAAELPLRDPIVAAAQSAGRVVVGTGRGRVFVVEGEDVTDISIPQPTSGMQDEVAGLQDVAVLGDTVYAVDHKCRVHVRRDERWSRLAFPEPLASPSPAWTTVRFTRLDDESLLLSGSRGLATLLVDGKRIDLSFGWQPTGEIVCHLPGDGEFCVVATQHMRKVGGADPGYVVTANRERVRVLRAPTAEPAAAVFGRSENEIYLLTKWGRVHRFDGQRWTELTKDRLEADWNRIGFPEGGPERWRILPFQAIHSPEPGVVFVAHPLFRFQNGSWEMIDLPDAFRPSYIPFDSESIEPDTVVPQTGWRGDWIWPQITDFAGTSATALRLETTKYPLRFDGEHFERVARKGQFAAPGTDVSEETGAPWSKNPFYVHRRRPDLPQWVRIQR